MKINIILEKKTLLMKWMGLESRLWYQSDGLRVGFLGFEPSSSLKWLSTPAPLADI